MSSFIKNNKDIEEEDEDEQEAEQVAFEKARRDSDNFKMPLLDEVEQAKLTSCIDEVRSVVGDSVSERRIVETSIRFGYDITKILDEILNDECQNKAKRRQQESENTRKPLSHQIAAPRLITSNNEGMSTSTIKTITATTAFPEKRGFEISSPKPQASPVVSGRNTPVDASNEDTAKNASNISASIFKVSKEQAQRNAKQIYEKERADQKSHFHMICIGHVDAGKSTLMGHLLFDTGNVSQRVMHKHEQESKKMGKQSFMYAWVLDETGEERARGMLAYIFIICLYFVIILVLYLYLFYF